MILEKQKLIYIHIPKTGGQSVCKYLIESIGHEYHEYRSINDSRYGFYCKDNWNSNHFYYEEYLKKQIKNPEQYFKFTTVRNPYNKYLSACKYRGFNPNDTSLKRNILTQTDFKPDIWRHFSHQYKFFTYDRKIVVDKIFKLEDAPFNITNFFKTNYNFNGEFPHINSSGNESDYLTSLTRDTKDFINFFYEKDFEILGYERT